MLRGYRGSFNTLSFGEKKPSLGSYHNGRLGLFYYRDPGLKSGEVVPALDEAYGSAAGAKVGLLHRFILGLFAATN